MKGLFYFFIALGSLLSTTVHSQTSWKDARSAYSRLINDSTKLDSAFHMAMLADEIAQEQFGRDSKLAFYSRNSLAVAHYSCKESREATEIWKGLLHRLRLSTDTSLNEVKSRVANNLLKYVYTDSLESADSALEVARLYFRVNEAKWKRTFLTINDLVEVAERLERTFGIRCARPIYSEAADLRKELFGERDYRFILGLDSAIGDARTNVVARLRKLTYEYYAVQFTHSRLDQLIFTSPEEAGNFWSQYIYAVALKDMYAKFGAIDTECLYHAGVEQMARVLQNCFHLSGPAFYCQQEAIEAYKERDGYLSVITANAFRNLGALRRRNQDYMDAIACFKEAAGIEKKVSGANSDAYAKSLLEIGKAYGLISIDTVYQFGLNYFNQSLAIRKKLWGAKGYWYGKSQLDLATYYEQHANFDQALKYLDSCVLVFNMYPELAAKNNDLELVYWHYSYVYRLQEEHAKADYWANKFFEVSAKQPYASSADVRSIHARNLALSYYYQHDVFNLKRMVDTQASLLAEVSPKNQGDYKLSLYLYLKTINQPQDADTLLESNLAILFRNYDSTTNEFQHDVGAIRSHLMESYLVQGKYDEARRIALDVLAAHHKLKVYYVISNTLPYYVLARWSLSHGDFGQALRFADTSLFCTTSTRGNESYDAISTRLDRAMIYWSASFKDSSLRVMYDAYWQLADVVVKSMQGFTERQRQKYISTLTDNLQKYYSYFAASDPQNVADPTDAYNLVLRSKGILLSTTNGMNRALASTKNVRLRRQFRTLKDIQQTLANAFGYTSDQLQAAHLSIDSLQRVADSLERDLSRQSPSFAQSLKSDHSNSASVSSALQPGEAAVEFVAYKKFNPTTFNFSDTLAYAAFVVRKDEPTPAFIPLTTEAVLAPLVSLQIGGGLDAEMDEESNDAQQHAALYNTIWKPLAMKLDGIHRIYIANDGLTAKIAFAALTDTAGTYLSDKYELHFLLNTRDVGQQKETAFQLSTAALFGGMRYDGKPGIDTGWLTASRSLSPDLRGTDSFDYLKGSREEVTAIRDILQQRLNHLSCDTGAAASEAAFKKMDGKSPSLIHVATHGFYFPLTQVLKTDSSEGNGGVIRYTINQNPLLRAGLAFAGANASWLGKEVATKEDGILTAYELANLDLSNTQLAVLSACETGIGEIQNGEGVFGLQRALRQAGVRQMLVSLWPVSDPATARMMELFYKRLSAGMPPAQALREAQLAMRGDETLTPAEWAGFELIE